MEIKKATPEKITLKNPQGRDTKFGTMYDYAIKFPGSEIEFMYSSKSATQDKFKEGVETEFEYEKKTGTKQDGSPWELHKVKPVSAQQGGYSGGGGGSKSYFNLDNEKLKQKINTVSYATSYSKDLASLDKIKVEDMEAEAEKMIAFMWKKIDEIG